MTQAAKLPFSGAFSQPVETSLPSNCCQFSSNQLRKVLPGLDVPSVDSGYPSWQESAAGIMEDAHSAPRRPITHINKEYPCMGSPLRPFSAMGLVNPGHQCPSTQPLGEPDVYGAPRSPGERVQHSDKDSTGPEAGPGNPALRWLPWMLAPGHTLRNAAGREEAVGQITRENALLMIVNGLKK